MPKPPDFNALIASLNAADTAKRRRAVDSLGKLNTEAALDTLTEVALSQSGSATCYRAVETIGKMTVAGAVDALSRIVSSHPNSTVCGVAIEALGGINSDAALEVLVKALFAKSNGMNPWQAIRAIATMTIDPALDALILALSSHPDQIVRYNAARAIGQFRNPKATPALVEAMLHDSELSVSALAAESLGEIGDAAAVEPLIAALQSSNDHLSYNAGTALRKIGDPRAIPLLRQQGRYSDLVYFGPAVLPELVDALFTAFNVRAARGLVTGTGQELPGVERRRMIKHYLRVQQARDPLTDALTDLGWTPQTLDEKLALAIWNYDIATLVGMGAEAVPALINLLNCKYPAATVWRHHFAAPALLEIGTPEAVAAVKAWKKSK